MQKKAIFHQAVPSPCMAPLLWKFKYVRKAQQEEKEREKTTPKFIFLVYGTGYFKLASVEQMEIKPECPKSWFEVEKEKTNI